MWRTFMLTQIYVELTISCRLPGKWENEQMQQCFSIWMGTSWLTSQNSAQRCLPQTFDRLLSGLVQVPGIGEMCAGTLSAVRLQMLAAT